MDFNENNRYEPDMFMLEGFYAVEPPLDAQAWQQALARHLGTVAIVNDGRDGGTMMLALEDYCLEYEDKDEAMPAMVVIMRGEKDEQDYSAALQQSWDWADARQAVSASRHNLLAHELMARGLPMADRYKIFHALTQTLIELTAPLAIYPVQTGCFFDPARWLAVQADGQKGYGFINVRFFTISNHEGDMLMDSCGLGVFGVPDVQCHYRQWDPQDMAERLYNTAAYLMEHGDVIEDGHTIFEEHWRCRHEDALIEPVRTVLDICPHAPHAAGNRG